MSPTVSSYLDIVRLSAALIVFVSHLAWHRISGGFLWWFDGIGHDGVVIFFVLSGFVISYVSATKETQLRDYALSRLARLYSVVIPAIILTFVADSIGSAHAPNLYEGVNENLPFVRMLVASIFLSDIWHFDFSLMSNDAYWSLPYEFWYYVMFGLAFYLAGKTRIVTLFCAALIAGPNILLMFPLWLMGVAAYRFCGSRSLERHVALAIFVASLVGMIGIFLADTHHLVSRATSSDWPPGFSFVDYIAGTMVALNLIAIANLKSLKIPFPT